jgi:hypothetical protein
MITFNTRLSTQRSRRAPEISEPTLAPVNVIQYGDFERFRKQIQFAYRHFPRESIHPNAVQAAEAAECARAQNRFWAMHDVLIANQDHLELQYIYGYAEYLDLAMARFTAEMDDEVYLPAVRAHLDISCGLGSLFEATENAIRRWRDAPVLPLG